MNIKDIEKVLIDFIMYEKQGVFNYTESDAKKYIQPYMKLVNKNDDLHSVSKSYSEKDMDDAYDKGFKDAMIKYRKQ